MLIEINVTSAYTITFESCPLRRIYRGVPNPKTGVIMITRKQVAALAAVAGLSIAGALVAAESEKPQGKERGERMREMHGSMEKKHAEMEKRHAGKREQHKDPQAGKKAEEKQEEHKH
jgi:hypothetical protein